MPAPGIMSSENPNWRTPPEVFAPLHQEFQFDIDLAADTRSHLLPAWLGPGGIVENALVEEWSLHGDVGFLNPPYSRKLRLHIAPWLQIAQRVKMVVVALVPARTDTAWWHNPILSSATEIRIVEGRVNFLNPETGLPGNSGGTFPSAVVIWEPRRSRTPRPPLVVPVSFR